MELSELKKIYTFGNHKLSKRIIIFSISNYKKCASKALGLCPDWKICYGRQGIYNFKNAVEKQERCEKYWDNNTANKIAIDISRSNRARRRNNKLDYFRFNEVSDFRNNEDVFKLNIIARQLLSYDIKTYTYTHRSDLIKWFKNVCFTVRGSGFRINGRQTRIYKVDKGVKQVKLSDIELSKNEVICQGYKKDVICGENCHHCMNNKKDIVFVEHGGNKRFKIID